MKRYLVHLSVIAVLFIGGVAHAQTQTLTLYVDNQLGVPGASGYVTVSPGAPEGDFCNGLCSFTYPTGYDVIHITAHFSGQQRLYLFSGCDFASGTECDVVMSGPKAVTTTIVCTGPVDHDCHAQCMEDCTGIKPPSQCGLPCSNECHTCL